MIQGAIDLFVKRHAACGWLAFDFTNQGAAVRVIFACACGDTHEELAERDAARELRYRLMRRTAPRIA